MQKLKIGFISCSNPIDRSSWSGTQFKFYESLSLIGDVIWLPARINSIYKVYNLIYKLLAKCSNRRCSTMHTYLGAYLISHSIDRSMIKDCDLLFCLNSSMLYCLNTNKPIFYFADATFNSLYGYYDSFSNFFKTNVIEGNQIELKALYKASHIVYSSYWAKESAVNDYNISADKISVIEFGANIDEKDIISNNKKYTGTFHLLFLGVEWERKGGDVAVETCKILNHMGIKSILHIVGIRTLPIIYRDIEFIDHIGFLNKNNPDEYAKLVNIVSTSDILLLPTKAECAGIVFSEASANQLPIFTYDTGGVANYVINGINGYRLDLSCKATDFAEKISSCISSGEIKYLQLGCKAMYQERLNWGIWAKRVEKLFRRLLEKDGL